MTNNKSVFIKCPSCKTNLEVANFNEILYDITGEPDDTGMLEQKALKFCSNFSESGDAEAYLWMGGENFHSSFAFGERMYEYPFVIRQLKSRGLLNSNVLDVGSAHTVLPGVLASLGCNVTCLDFQKWKVSLPNVQIKSGNILDFNGDLGKFDVITCISTLEHVGLGRWRDPDDVDGDKKAMNVLAEILNPGGVLLLSVPCGMARVVFPLHRVYNESRLKTVFGRFSIDTEEFFKTIDEGRAFEPCIRGEAFSSGTGTLGGYSIGCFALHLKQ